MLQRKLVPVGFAYPLAPSVNPDGMRATRLAKGAGREIDDLNLLEFRRPSSSRISRELLSGRGSKPNASGRWRSSRPEASCCWFDDAEDFVYAFGSEEARRLGEARSSFGRRLFQAVLLQIEEVVADSTHDKNRLRAILLESCPEFESLVDLSDERQVNLLAKVGGPWQIADADPRVVGALTRGANRDAIDELVASVATSTRPLPAVVDAEGRSVRTLAARIADNDVEAAALDEAIAELLSGDETFECLLTVPGIGVRTATELVVSIDITRFANDDKLASYCGLAPKDSKSGSSISSVTSSRQGNKRLKNLLIFSCNSIARSRNRFGEYYRTLTDVRHMPHGKALKAVARKRLKVIYAIMRDKVPYAAYPAPKMKKADRSPPGRACASMPGTRNQMAKISARNT